MKFSIYLYRRVFIISTLSDDVSKTAGRVAHSVDPDQTQQNGASDLDLHCLFRPVCPITKTRIYYFDPLKPHFYIVKLGFTGAYIIFLI